MERKNTTLSERFSEYRKNVSKETTMAGGLPPKKRKEVSIPEITYPGELDIQEELSNLIGYDK